MGNTYAVEAWGDHFGNGTKGYMRVWGGESFFRAILELRKAKKKGFRCVKLEWRG